MPCTCAHHQLHYIYTYTMEQCLNYCCIKLQTIKQLLDQLKYFRFNWQIMCTICVCILLVVLCYVFDSGWMTCCIISSITINFSVSVCYEYFIIFCLCNTKHHAIQIFEQINIFLINIIRIAEITKKKTPF